MNVQTQSRSLALRCCGVDLNREHLFAPVLRADVINLRPFARYEVVHPTGKTRPVRMGGAKVLEHRHFGEFVGEQKRMWKDGGVLGVEPVENLNGQLHFHAARHINECAGTDEGLMERGELRRPERGWLRHEMFSEQIFVFEQSSLERH